MQAGAQLERGSTTAGARRAGGTGVAAALMAATAMSCGGPATGSTSSVTASTPSLMWDGVTTLGVHCSVAPNEITDHRALTTSLCEQVRRLAAEKSPVPVTVIGFGDPALVAPDTLTILVHAAVQPNPAGGRQALLVVAMRPFRMAGDATFFGAAPRAMPLPADAGGDPSLETALRAGLSETLPWLSSRDPLAT